MGIAEGLALHSYINELPRQEEEAKLKAQLFKSQADHINAQTGLLQLQAQQKQAFMAGLPQALAGPQDQSSPVPSDLASQPAGPNPGAPTIGQLHTTNAFADPDSQQMQRISGLAFKTGNIQDFSAMQQGMLEMQKVKLQQRTQQLQDQLAMYQQMDAGLPDVPVNAERKNQLRLAQVGVLHQLGKSEQAIELYSGKTVPVAPGGSVARIMPGAATGQEVYKSSTSLRQKAAEEEQGRYDTRLGGAGHEMPSPVPPRRPSARVSSGPAIPTTPGVAPADDTAQLRQSLLANGAREDNVDDMMKVMLKVFQPVTPSAPARPAGQSNLGREKQIAAEEELRAQGIEPSNPTNPVALQKERQQLQGQTGVLGATLETAAQQREQGTNRGKGLQVGLNVPSIPEQEAGIRESKEAPTTAAHVEYRAFQNAQRALQEINKFSAKDVEQWVGVLRSPGAKVGSLLSDMAKPGSGNKDRERWAAAVGDLFYHLGVPEAGKNFTQNEKEMINKFLTTGDEWNYTQYKQKIDRLGTILPQKEEDAYKRATQTKGEMRQERSKGAPTSTAPANETPQQLYEKLKARMK